MGHVWRKLADMSEIITRTRAEDAVSAADAFLSEQRGAGIDGDFAAAQVASYVNKQGSATEALLTFDPYPGQDGFYVPLSKRNASMYNQAATSLVGHVVLVPSVLSDPNTKGAFYPAVVSQDGLKTGDIRLHVLQQPYRRGITYGASMVLSAAGQSETKGIGEHGRKSSDGVEAEHFATLLAAGTDEKVQTAWRAGQHINHTWRRQPGNSVTTEVSKRLFGRDIPQKTITISKQAVETGKAMLLWHEGLRDQQTGKPEAATKEKALVIIQGLGYQALRSTNPQGIETVKRLIA